MPFSDLCDRDTVCGEVGIAGKNRIDGRAIGSLDDDHCSAFVGEWPRHSNDALVMQFGQMAAMTGTCCQSFRRGDEAEFDDPHVGRLGPFTTRGCIC